jgi:DNA-binding transcriptional ArsR family regulator
MPTDPTGRGADVRVVKALAHPLRVRILAMLGERDASPVQMAQLLGSSLGTIAYHVRTLEGLGLIEMGSTRQRRGATEHVYRALPRPDLTAAAWAVTSPVAKQAIIGALLQQAGDYATRSAAAGGFDRPEAVAARRSLRLDEQGFKALGARMREWLAEVEELAAASEERVAATGEVVAEAGLVTLLFEGRPLLPAMPGAAATPATPAVRAVTGPPATGPQPIDA